MKNQKGFALLEILIATAILAAMASVGMVSWIQIANVKYKKKTEQVLLETKDAFVLHYDLHGQVPGHIDELAPLLQTAPPIRDGWGQPLVLMPNVLYAPEGGTAVAYDAAIISPGRDATVNSSKDESGLLSLSDQDTATLVQLDAKRQEKVQQALAEMQQLTNAFLSHYDKTGTLATSFADLAGHHTLGRKDSEGNLVDPWGIAYAGIFGGIASGGAFEVTSAGLDRAAGSAQDLKTFVAPAVLASSARNITAARLSSAKAALVVYQANWGNPGCNSAPTTCVANLIADPLGNALMDGKNAYDAWGRLFRYNSTTGTFFSAGPDGDPATTGDNVE